MLIFFSVPCLTVCGVYDEELVDEGLADTYEDLPMLPGYVCVFYTFTLLYDNEY